MSEQGNNIAKSIVAHGRTIYVGMPVRLGLTPHKASQVYTFLGEIAGTASFAKGRPDLETAITDMFIPMETVEKHILRVRVKRYEPSADHVENQRRYACKCGQQPCIICGRPCVMDRPETLLVHLVDGGGVILHPEDERHYIPDGGDVGCYPISADCARNHPELTAYIIRSHVKLDGALAAEIRAIGARLFDSPRRFVMSLGTWLDPDDGASLEPDTTFMLWSGCVVPATKELTFICSGITEDKAGVLGKCSIDLRNGRIVGYARHGEDGYHRVPEEVESDGK